MTMLEPLPVRLRERIDAVTAQRDAARYEVKVLRAAANLRERRLFNHCPFCGTPCVGPACAGHRDLVDIEQETHRV